VKSFFQNLDL